MESTANFQAGLQAAYEQLNREGRLSDTDRRVFGDLNRLRSRRIFALRRAQLRVRRLYARTTGVLLPLEIDWTKVIEWLKDNWVEIMKILASLLMLFI